VDVVGGLAGERQPHQRGDPVVRRAWGFRRHRGPDQTGATRHYHLGTDRGLFSDEGSDPNRQRGRIELGLRLEPGDDLDRVDDQAEPPATSDRVPQPGPDPEQDSHRDDDRYQHDRIAQQLPHVPAC
jgi:hypothetical protein